MTKKVFIIDDDGSLQQTNNLPELWIKFDIQKPDNDRPCFVKTESNKENQFAHYNACTDEFEDILNNKIITGVTYWLGLPHIDCNLSKIGWG